VLTFALYVLAMHLPILQQGELVEEWEASDEVVQTIESRRNIVLRVVTEQFKNGKHGETSILEFLGGALFQNIWGEFGLAL
jgi:hypothetical protein